MPGNALLSVDPGLGSTGWAVWRGERLMRVGLVHAPRNGTLVQRATALSAMLGQELIGVPLRNAGRVVVELPEFQGSVSRSMGWKTGDLQSLVFLVGVICADMVALQIPDVELVKPSEWKGQLPKNIVIDRLRQRLGRARCDDLGIEKDAWDAVGIGMWAQGRF